MAEIRISKLILAALFFLLFASLVNAAEKTQTWVEHPDAVQVLIATLFAALIFFVVRTLRKIDANQTLLFDKYNTLADEFHVLKGEHQAFAGKCRK
jgi:hypothetical protein